MRALYNEMKQAGLSHSEMFYEAAAAVGVLALPILLMLVGQLTHP